MRETAYDLDRVSTIAFLYSLTATLMPKQWGQKWRHLVGIEVIEHRRSFEMVHNSSPPFQFF